IDVPDARFAFVDHFTDNGRRPADHRPDVDAIAFFESGFDRGAQLAARRHRNHDRACLLGELGELFPFGRRSGLCRLAQGELRHKNDRNEKTEQTLPCAVHRSPHKLAYSNRGISIGTPAFSIDASKSRRICGSSSSYSIIVPPSRTLVRTPSL